jgi:hypothetical protein
MPEDKPRGPEIIKDMEPHFNRGLGKQINSRREYKEEMKRQGVENIPFEDLPGSDDKWDEPYELTDAEAHFAQEVSERIERGEDPQVVESDVRERLERHR